MRTQPLSRRERFLREEILGIDEYLFQGFSTVFVDYNVCFMFCIRRLEVQCLLITSLPKGTGIISLEWHSIRESALSVTGPPAVPIRIRNPPLRPAESTQTSSQFMHRLEMLHCVWLLNSNRMQYEGHDLAMSRCYFGTIERIVKDKHDVLH